MNLKEYLSDSRAAEKEKILCREIMIAGRPALMLAMYETKRNYIPDVETYTSLEPLPDTIARLTVLCDYCDAPVDINAPGEDDSEGMTRREMFLQGLNDQFAPSPSDPYEFRIDGVTYDVLLAEYCELGFWDYGTVAVVNRLAEKGLISQQWLDKDIDELSIAKYDIHPDILRKELRPGSLVETASRRPPETGKIGSVLQLNCGHYDTPRSVIVQNEDGEMIPLKIYGAYPLDPDDGFLDDPDYGSDFDSDFLIDEDLFIIEYSTDEDMTLDFYLPEYLDLPTYEGPEGVTVFGTDEYTGGRRMCIAGPVPDDYDPYGDIMVELFSYTRYR